MNSIIHNQTSYLLEKGWKWKNVKGMGQVLTCPDDKTYPLKKIMENIYIPEFIKIKHDNAN